MDDTDKLIVTEPIYKCDVCGLYIGQLVLQWYLGVGRCGSHRGQLATVLPDLHGDGGGAI